MPPHLKKDKIGIAFSQECGEDRFQPDPASAGLSQDPREFRRALFWSKTLPSRICLDRRGFARNSMAILALMVYRGRGEEFLNMVTYVMYCVPLPPVWEPRVGSE